MKISILNAMKKIYLDYASLTPVDRRVYRVMSKFSNKKYGNPGALYSSAVEAKNAMNDARERVAKVLHARKDEIIFAGSGTEANNLAIQGIMKAYKGKHMIVSEIEHSSVLETAKALEETGVEVTYLKVDKDGIVDLEELKKIIKPETILISVMMVNNEVGTIEPIQEIAKIVRDARKRNGTATPFFHTDACQAPNTLDVYVEKLNIDALTLDGHKIYGPRGVGMLFLRKGVRCEPIIFGGGQESGLRSATENISGMQGFARALEISEKERAKESARLFMLKEYFIDELKKIDPHIFINGNPATSSSHILSVSISGVDSEFFVLQLDVKGVECSTKSACLRDEDESYVLRSIGVDSKNSIRFSFGRGTSKGEIKKTLDIIKKLLSNFDKS